MMAYLSSIPILKRQVDLCLFQASQGYTMGLLSLKKKKCCSQAEHLPTMHKALNSWQKKDTQKLLRCLFLKRRTWSQVEWEIYI